MRDQHVPLLQPRLHSLCECDFLYLKCPYRHGKVRYSSNLGGGLTPVIILPNNVEYFAHASIEISHRFGESSSTGWKLTVLQFCHEFRRK